MLLALEFHLLTLTLNFKKSAHKDLLALDAEVDHH